MKEIKLSIIGMGRMGITHFSIINSHPNVNIVSVSDTSKITLDLLKKYIPSLQVFTDYKELIDKTMPDAIIVCTPPNYHYAICKYACEKGINVFCEKPFTLSTQEADELQEMFNKKGLINQVGYVNRFNDMFTTAREYVKEGLLGDILRFKSEMFSCTISKPETGESWRGKRESGGGAVYEMAVHVLDLINYIIGVPNKVIGTSMNQIYSKHVEDMVSSTLIYDNGCVGTLYVNWSDSSYRKPSNKIEIFGTNGKLLVDQYEMKIFLNEPVSGHNYRKGWNTIYITDIFKPVPFYVRGNEFTRQLYYFADSVLAGKIVGATQCTFEDGYNTQRMVHDMFNDYDNKNKQD